MNQPTKQPPISAENLGFYCSQLLDNALGPEDLERLLQHMQQTQNMQNRQQTAHSPAGGKITEQLHRYALIRQHLQASPNHPVISHIDLSARVQAALNQTEALNQTDSFNQTKPFNQADAFNQDKTTHASNRFIRRRGRSTWVMTGLAAGITLAVSLSWLNQFPASAPTSTQLADMNAMDPRTRPVSVQELNATMLTQQPTLTAQTSSEFAQLRAYAQLADAERARFNEYFLMHASYGNQQNSGLPLARVADLPTVDYAVRQQHNALIIQSVGYQE